MTGESDGTGIENALGAIAVALERQNDLLEGIRSHLAAIAACLELTTEPGAGGEGGGYLAVKTYEQ